MNKEYLCNMEFVVSCLQDIRTLLNSWDQVVNEMENRALERVRYSIVNVLIEHRLPGEEVVLSFTAPERMLKRFLETLIGREVSFTNKLSLGNLFNKYEITPQQEE